MDTEASASTETAQLKELVHRQAARLEALEEEVRELRSQGVGRSALEDSRPASPTEAASAGEPVSRRRMLRSAGLVGLGSALVGGAIGSSTSAAAATGDPMILGSGNNIAGFSTTLSSGDELETLVVANTGQGSAIIATNGINATRPALWAVAKNAQPAVQGTGGPGTGVLGTSSTSFSAVHGETSGSGSATSGRCLNNAGSGAGVFGEGPGTSRGVWGRNIGTNAAGIGVYGESAAGRGASFGGKVASLQLRATAAATHPASGQRGDLFVDNTGRLWFCKGTTTWKQLA